MNKKVILNKDWNFQDAYQEVTAAKKVLSVGDAIEICFPIEDWRNAVLVENTLPVHACTVNKNKAVWTLDLSHEVKQIKVAKNNDDHMLFVGCSHGPEQFASVAISSVAAANPNILLLDALPDSYDWSKFAWYERATILKLPFAYKFTEIMNVAFTWALMKKYEYIGFMHADSEARDHMIWDKLLNHARESKDKVGVWYTVYDVLALFRSETIIDAGFWDESFTHYYADNDYYHRVRMAGWKCDNSGLTGINHYGSYTIKHCKEKQKEHHDHAWSYSSAHYVHKWSNGRHQTPYGI